MSIMTPMLALVVWTLVVFFWMYATRIPAMFKAGIRASKIKSKADLDVLPQSVKQVADNYNHLHEQPTLFYALVTYSQVVGVSDALNTKLAWAYVALRVVHSLIQGTVNYVPLRFTVFVLGSFVLMAIAARNLAPLFM